jgi:MOSC domain-containing protein YiiM
MPVRRAAVHAAGATLTTIVPDPRVVALYLKRAHRGPMDPVSEASAVAGQGLEGSVGRGRRRQVTLLELENWHRSTADVGSDADPSRRRANIVVSGIALAHTRGRVLRIGDVRLAVGGELTPCERMDEVHPGLQAALRPDWRAGVFAQVLDGGVIRVGDPIEWEAAAVSAEPARA